ncbi:MAG: hypothetical protein KAU23_05200 [Anaerolineales bacterium]|nr:hypothetical protein [Anaerolineales bacterium]
MFISAIKSYQVVLKLTYPEEMEFTSILSIEVSGLMGHNSLLSMPKVSFVNIVFFIAKAFI